MIFKNKNTMNYEPGIIWRLQYICPLWMYCYDRVDRVSKMQWNQLKSAIKIYDNINKKGIKAMNISHEK